MRITMARHHEGKVEEVVDLLTDPAGHSGRIGEMTHRPTIAAGGGETTVVELRRTLDSGDPMIPDRVELVERITWHPASPDGRRTADIEAELAGVPVSVDGRVEVVPTDDGCHCEVELDLRCTVPVLGGRLMSVVGRMATDRLTSELDAVDAALADRR